MCVDLSIILVIFPGCFVFFAERDVILLCSACRHGQICLGVCSIRYLACLFSLKVEYTEDDVISQPKLVISISQPDRINIITYTLYT